MIVGVAQVVVNVGDLASRREQVLREPGATETFAAYDLPNEPIKAPFQAAPREQLDMLHVARAGSTALELTRYHGERPTGRASYSLRLEPGAPPVAVLPASDPHCSSRFWSEGMRFKPGAGTRFVAPAAHPAWQLEVELIAAPRGADVETSVDAEGCVLVTLLTTGLERELERLHDTGLLLRSSASWQERIADRELNVAFVEGPSGELVELLQAPRK